MESFVWQKKCVLLSVDPIISDARFVRISEDCILDRGMGKGEFVFTDVKKKEEPEWKIIVSRGQDVR